MKVKVFYPNQSNKIEFTREELEKVLNEVYEDGFSDGRRSVNQFSWTSPNITTTPYYTTDHTITISNCSDSVNSLSDSVKL